MEEVIKYLKKKNNQIFNENTIFSDTIETYKKGRDKYFLNESKLDLLPNIRNYKKFVREISDVEKENYSDTRKMAIISTLGSLESLYDISDLSYEEKFLLADGLCINSIECYEYYMLYIARKDVLGKLLSSFDDEDDKLDMMEFIFDYIDSYTYDGCDENIANMYIKNLIEVYGPNIKTKTI